MYGGAIMRSEGTRASHRGIGTHVGATSAWGGAAQARFAGAFEAAAEAVKLRIKTIAQVML